MDFESGFDEQTLKNRFPFRLGTTSYIIPDEIEPNIKYLSDKIDDIEVVLFESDEFSNIPSPDLVARMADMAEEYDLTYTVHLPLDAHLGHADEAIRRSSVDKCLRIIERMSPTRPFAYVLHLSNESMGDKSDHDLSIWSSQNRKSIEELLGVVKSRDLCVETLSYPYEFVASTVMDYDLSVCLDIGHILLCGYPLESYLDRYLNRTRIIHLHGIDNGKDHVDISYLDKPILDLVVERLYADSMMRVLTLEIFEEAHLKKSLDILRRYICE